MGHKQAGYNGEAACLFVSQPACGRHNFFVRYVSKRAILVLAESETESPSIKLNESFNESKHCN